MKINLFTTLYRDKNILRQNEIETCLLENILNSEIDKVIVVIDCQSLFYGVRSNTLKTIQKILEEPNSKANALYTNKRPTFNDYFSYTEDFVNDINIIANSDIIFDSNSLIRLRKWNWKNHCLALSRYDIQNVSNLYSGKLFARADSQDAWIVKGSFPKIIDANFTMGVAGCDNVIAHHLSKYYTIVNASLDIKIYHLHLTNVRNYIENGKIDEIVRLKPPYKLIQPICLPIEN